MAQTLFHTSDFYQTAQEKKAEVSRFTNPELCQITEDLFFTDPYIDHERNQFDPALLPQVLELRNDAALRLAVAGLKHRFLSKAEALLHGDIHSGSVFVAEGKLKAIDAEFGFYGPIGFDVGTALGNLLLNYCGLPGLFGPRDAAAGREQRLQDVRELWLIFADRFLVLCHQQTREAALAVPGYAEQFLQQVWTDAVGYCGSELIRRTIGLAHVADLDSISDAEMRAECQRNALGLGRALIVNAPQIEHIDALLARIRQNG
ncbi:Methylthioribose kinase [compost metagenome]